MYIKLERKKVAIRVEKHKNRSITQKKQLSKKKTVKNIPIQLHLLAL